MARSHSLLTAEAKAPSLYPAASPGLAQPQGHWHFAASPSPCLVVKYGRMRAGQPVKGEPHLEALIVP